MGARRRVGLRTRPDGIRVDVDDVRFVAVDQDRIAHAAWIVAVLTLSGSREWRNRQTRTVQVRVPVRAWGFNSPLAHPRTGL